MCLLAPAKFLKQDCVVGCDFLVNHGEDKLLLGVLLAFIHSVFVVISGFIQITELLLNHGDVVICLCELSSKQVKALALLLAQVSDDGPLEVVKGLLSIVVNLEPQETQVEVGFNVVLVNLKTAVVNLT